MTRINDDRGSNQESVNALSKTCEKLGSSLSMYRWQWCSQDLKILRANGQASAEGESSCSRALWRDRF